MIAIAAGVLLIAALFSGFVSFCVHELGWRETFIVLGIWAGIIFVCVAASGLIVYGVEG